MAKRATLTDVSTGYSSGSTLNDNFVSLNKQFDNTISRDGSTPNTMGGDLDLDSNDLLNAGKIDTKELILNGEKTVSVSSTPDWKGPWATATAYALNDMVSHEGSSYIAVVAHTSSTFSSDLTNNYWELFAKQGSAGDGTGDMLAANNLSDLVDVSTARSNLGLGTAATTASSSYATAAQGTKADNAIPKSDISNDSTLGGGSPSTTKVPSESAVQDYVDNNTVSVPMGFDPSASWQTRIGAESGDTFQNTSDYLIAVTLSAPENESSGLVQVSTTGSSWLTLGTAVAQQAFYFTVPPGNYYKVFSSSSTFSIPDWFELKG